jgi:glutamate-1-semialdehyde aminotransferase
MTQQPRESRSFRAQRTAVAGGAADSLNLNRLADLTERAGRVIWKGGKESIQHEALRTCGFPRFASRSTGQFVWDANGNQYVDYLMAWGTVLLGHSHPEVERAVSEQLARGSLMNLAIAEEVELAERIVRHVPGAEQVRFLASGSEAANAAVRIARCVTGREIIVHYGFHGWLDWCQGEHPAGILPAVLNSTLTMRFNDADDLQKIFEAHRGEIACVIMEPAKDEEPAEGYLQAVRELTREHGSLLIFDEAKTGFRFGLGGAQAYYGVTPDLSVFSKAVANGYPLAVVAGKAEVLGRAADVWVSGTYHGWPLAIAAANATLTVLEREPVAEHVWSMGRRLMDGCNARLAGRGFESRLAGAPAMPKLHSPAHEIEQIRGLIANMLQRGYFIHPTHPWFISYAHDEPRIDATVEAFAAALAEMESS